MQNRFSILIYLLGVLGFMRLPAPANAQVLDVSGAVFDAALATGSLNAVTLHVTTCPNVTGNETSADPVRAILSTPEFSSAQYLGKPTTYGGELTATFIGAGINPDFASLTISKVGTNAWCISKVWLEADGQVIWSHPSAQAKVPGYIGIYPLKGNLWVDEEPGLLPSVRFADFVVSQAKGAPKAPLEIEFHTCAAGADPGTDDAVSVVLSRDTPNAQDHSHPGVEAIVLDNPGDDREANQPDRYRLDDQGIGTLWSVAVQKVGKDGWCFDRMSVFVGGVRIFNSTEKVVLDGASASALAERRYGVGWLGTGTWDGLFLVGREVEAVGTPALPLKSSATFRWYGYGGAGQECRPFRSLTPGSAALLGADRCNDGLACSGGNKCVASGAPGQICNEVEPYFTSVGGKIASAVVPACDPPKKIEDAYSCIDNKCVVSGGWGEPCNVTGPACDASPWNLRCYAGSCIPNGEENGFCYEIDPNAESAVRCAEPDQVCVSNICKTRSRVWQGVWGKTNCAYGDPSCNRCVNDVVKQFKSMGSSSGAYAHSYSAMLEDTYDPSGEHFPAFFTPSDGGHVQSFLRLPITGPGPIAGTGAKPQWFVTDYGKAGVLYAVRMSANTWAGPTLEPRVKGEVTNIFDAETVHPGGMSVVGKYLLVAASGSSDDYHNGVHVYTYKHNTDGSELGLTYLGKQQEHYVSAVAAIRNDVGDYTILASSNGAAHTYYRWRGKLSEPEGWTYVDEWKDVPIFENMTMVTECNTGKVFLIGATANETNVRVTAELFGLPTANALSNRWALYDLSVSVEGNRMPLVYATDAPFYNKSRCNARGGASVHAGMNGELLIYCHEKEPFDLGNRDEFDFEEWAGRR